MKKISKILIILVVISSVFSCATKKSRDDVSKLGMFYHNTTAEYNGYFNANVLLNESIVNLNTQHQDNYNQILDLYKYAASDNPKAVAGPLDEAMKKVSVVVNLHRVSHWTDDCYLLLGKAQYVKQDYEAAEETFEYMAEEYSPEALEKKNREKARKLKGKKKKKARKAKTKKVDKERKEKQKTKEKERDQTKKEREKERKRKIKERKEAAKKGKKVTKKKVETPKVETPKVETPKPAVTETPKKEKEEGEDPDKYFLKHKPAFQEGLLWLARTYIERDDFDSAHTTLMKLEKDTKTFKDVRKELASVRAYYFLKKKDYQKAIEPLQKAVELSGKRSEKARYTYIIAQIHQMEGRADQASVNYKKVLKYKPTYEMEFRTRLNLTQSSWLNGEATAEQATKDLEKMLKDTKNKEYVDQIYFALAEVALKNNDKPGATEHLLASLQNNQGNAAQRAESYLMLADLYFEAEEFVKAKNYFDSTLTVLPESDERHFRAVKYSTNLTEIAENILIIETQDSLLAINNLSTAEKAKLAQQMKDSQAKKPAKLGAGGKDIRKSAPSRPIGFPSAGGADSNWWAYNDKMKKKGKRDFEKLWGFDRKDEDNWRRSNKRGIGDLSTTDEGEEEEVDTDLTDAEIKKLLKDVPGTPEEIAAANDKIVDAMYKLGTLFRDRLENNEKTVETLEGELLKRYPANKHELDAWYYLYLSHGDLKASAKSKSYADNICKKYPESNYCNIIQDPNYLKNNKNKEGQLEQFYKTVYNAYDSGNYKEALKKLNLVDSKFGQTNPYQAKFKLLKAMCNGNVEGKDAYIVGLREVIAKFPNTPEQTRAKEIIRLLNGEAIVDDKPAVAGGDDRFKLEEEKVHYCIVVIAADKIKLTDAKNDVSDYHREFHSMDRLRISNIYLGADTNTPILVIRRFKDKEEAMEYHSTVMKNKKEFLGNNDNYEVFAVTQHNYREILKSKSLDGYREFFEENYK